MVAALQSCPKVEWVTFAPSGLEVTVVRRAPRSSDPDLIRAIRRAGVTARIIPTATIRMQIPGLDTDGERKRASKALLGVRGTRAVQVSKRDARATVVYETSVTSVAKIVSALKKAGFPVGGSS